jgi:lipid-A-disaccharide synthase
MRYYLIAGEASGDLHGSNLIKAIIKKDANAEIRAWGGDRMESAGATLVKHYRELAFMGFIEVLLNIRTIFRNIKLAKEDIQLHKPDVLILIDYPGFNMRIAQWAKKSGIKIVYYISPQVWAWKENRVKKLKTSVDEMLVILPFEKAFYQRWNWDVTYVGHPLMEAIDHFKQTRNPDSFSASNRKIIAILPGSRKQEILAKLPIMLSMVEHYPAFDWVVAMAPGQEVAFYQGFKKEYPSVRFVLNQTYELLMQADAALVTSGTATLETALFEVPQIICYKGNPLSYQIAKRLINIKYIGLVNLIMDKLVVKELIQDELNENELKKELDRILFDNYARNQIKSDYITLKRMLLQDKTASENAADRIVTLLNQSTQKSPN